MSARRASSYSGLREERAAEFFSGSLDLRTCPLPIESQISYVELLNAFSSVD
jgi:hypothetical protein